jgi:F-type H+-transporting ATPase subunit gamma
MPGSGLRDLRKRIRTTREIAQVTTAMDRASSARWIHYRQRLREASPHSRHLGWVVGELMREARVADHPLMCPSGGTRTMLAAFGGERGLCGGFHNLLADRIGEEVRSHRDAGVHLALMGRATASRLRRLGLAPQELLPRPARGEEAAVLDDIADRMAEGFVSGAWREVKVACVRAESAARQVPTVLRLLPVSPDVGFLAALAGPESAAGAPREERLFRLATFEPSPAELAARVVGALVRAIVRLAYLNSVAAEYAARQAAMSRASRNAGGIADELLLTYNRLRQEQITAQIMEVAAGAGEHGNG